MVGAGVVAVTLVVTWPRYGELAANWREWGFGPAIADQVWVTVTGAVIGSWLGRLIGFGLLGSTLRRLGVRLRMVPIHPDQAAGLKPIGDFYFYHSLLACARTRQTWARSSAEHFDADRGVRERDIEAH